MLLEFTKGADGKLIPCSDKSIDKVFKIKSGDIVLMDYKSKRNVMFHRKGFALLNLIFENQDKYDNLESMRKEFLLKAGHYDIHVTLKGVPLYIPKSMSFAEMDELEFAEIFSKFIDIALKHFVTMEKQELEEAILRYI